MAFLSIPLLGFSLIVLLAVYKYLIYPAFFSPLASIPNAHWSAPFSSLWILWVRHQAKENRTVHDAQKRLGAVVRLAPNEISVNDVNGLRVVYAGGFEKGGWYSIFDNYGIPCMFSSWYSKPHSARKRMISHIYSKSTIQSSPTLKAQAQIILLKRLLPILCSQAATSQSGIDIHSIFNATAMDFITSYLFGLKNDSNFLEGEEERTHWLGLYQSRKTHTFWNQELPRFTKFMRRFGVDLVPRWVDSANQELEDWTQARCESTINDLEKKEGKLEDEPVVMKAILTGISKEEKSKGKESVLVNETLKFKDKSIASEMIDHLAAGHETSGITLTYLSHHLSQDLELQEKLREELLTLQPTFELKNQENQLPSSKDLDALPLLHAIVMETLRHDASIPGNQPRQTPYPSCTLGGFQIPGGVRVGASAHSLHRNPTVYPNPEKFDHTRWLDGNGEEGNGMSEEQRKERDRWFWAFSSGGRMCVGSNFAMHEIKLVVAAIWTNFRTYVVDDSGMEQEDGYTCGPVGNRLVLRFERVGEV